MSHLRTCSAGHQWDPLTDQRTLLEERWNVCPVCGVAVEADPFGPTVAGVKAAPAVRGGHRAGLAAAVPQDRRVRVALVTGTGPRSASDIEALLQKRLRFFALLMAGFYSVLLIRIVPELLHSGGWPTHQLFFYELFKVFVFLMATAIAALLWSKKPLVLARQRHIELILFGMVMVQFIWVDYKILFIEKLPALIASRVEDRWGVVVVGAHLLSWFVLVVGYGTLIPNTWRRCALVVGIMAVTPW